MSGKNKEFKIDLDIGDEESKDTSDHPIELYLPQQKKETKSDVKRKSLASVTRPSNETAARPSNKTDKAKKGTVFSKTKSKKADLTLFPNDRTVLKYLWTMQHRNGGKQTPPIGLGAISKSCQVSLKTAQNCRDRLVNAELIVKKAYDPAGLIYHVMVSEKELKELTEPSW